MKELYEALKMITESKGKCVSEVDKYELTKMESILESLKSPIDFISHIGSDLIINGKNIFGHVENAKIYYSM